MKPKIEDTDIIIRQAANGWIVFSASGDRGIGTEYGEDHFITTVYEEDLEAGWGEHEALIRLFHDHFPGHIQSKNRGGGWIHTHCDDCHENWDKIRSKRWEREEDILDDEDERLYDRLIKEIIIECHSETLDWDEDRMRARLRKVIETRG